MTNMINRGLLGHLGHLGHLGLMAALGGLSCGGQAATDTDPNGVGGEGGGEGSESVAAGGLGAETDGGEGGRLDATPFTPDLGGDTPLVDLPPEDEEELCVALEDYVAANTGEDVRVGVCRILALQSIFDAALAGADPSVACEQSLTACLDSSAGAECPTPPADCTATVGELKQCLDGAAPALVALDSVAPTCEDIRTESLLTLAPSALALSTACSAMTEKCPTWLGTSQLDR